MALLEIKKQGEPVLKAVAEPVARITKWHKTLLDNMAETMYKANGVGLAAPQVGKSVRVIVIDVQDEHKLVEMINPVITAKEGKVVGQEGCLSIPNVIGDVERAEWVTVEYLNRQNRPKTLRATGLMARCIQHEVDHLDGILFVEKATNIHIEKPKKNANSEGNNND